jgi:hypothetical protein
MHKASHCRLVVILKGGQVKLVQNRGLIQLTNIEHIEHIEHIERVRLGFILEDDLSHSTLNMHFPRRQLLCL